MLSFTRETIIAAMNQGCREESWPTDKHIDSGVWTNFNIKHDLQQLETIN